MKIYSYVITHDTGFAPNPFHGILTLATCKPKIRLSATEGDLLVATGSARTVGNNKLVYAGLISGIVTLDIYGTDKRFSHKKPSIKGDWFNKHGDNIYEKVGSEWKQRRNPHHFLKDVKHDTSGQNVLLCKRFWYFGKLAIEIPPRLHEVIKKGPGHKIVKDSGLVEEFYDWLCGYETGIHGMPEMEQQTDKQLASAKKGCG